MTNQLFELQIAAGEIEPRRASFIIYERGKAPAETLVHVYASADGKQMAVRPR